MFVELRRFVALLLLPNISIVLFCLITSWYSLSILGLDALFAPVLKAWIVLKPILFKTLPAVAVWLWVNGSTKIVAWLGEFTTLIGALLGGWQAWSVKKLLRQVGRFLLSLSARFISVSLLLNLLFGHERRGLKSLPQFITYKLRSTWLGRVLQRWENASKRQKRLVLGVVLCLILVIAGQAMLGISVLLFDLVWELLLLLWRLVLVLWRALSPLLLKLIPNFIGNFFTGKVIPLLANVGPIIKDDHRVLYLRLNVRRHHRRIKAWLYLKSRRQRGPFRNRIGPLVGENIRSRKTAFLGAASNHEKSNSLLHKTREKTGGNTE